MTVIIRGPCLNGTAGEIRIQKDSGFTFCFHCDGVPLQYISLNIDNLSVVSHLVYLGSVGVVEHLFSVLYCLRLFNLRIDVHSKEIPFFDGSSKPFINPLLPFKREDLNYLRAKEIFIKEGDSYIHYQPVSDDKLQIEMELTHPYIKSEYFSFLVNEESYIKEIAPARTFVFTDESDPRLKDLPPYGIGITKKKIYSAEPLRFSDEPVRHKILDLLGDLFVLQKPLAGVISARNTSHRLNLKLARAILKSL
ncbi:MAG: UDP-3-O-acyl-N-acetylglucosamine deacetylase [candidate division WOR-3 bacterium]